MNCPIRLSVLVHTLIKQNFTYAVGFSEKECVVAMFNFLSKILLA